MVISMLNRIFKFSLPKEKLTAQQSLAKYQLFRLTSLLPANV